MERSSWMHRSLVAHVVLAVLLWTSMLFILLPATQAQQADNGLAKKLIEEGISAYQAERYDEAVSKLTQARSLVPSHSPTVLYLGLAYLRQDKTGEAIAAWQDYLKLQPYTDEERKAELPKTIPQYLTLLLREENHRAAREVVAREQQIGPGDPRTVAITYYRNLGSPELGPLQKGLTALLINDISQVKDLKVVERDLLQALLEELQLGTTGVVDEKTAPKVGRLLGAGKVATGSYLDVSKGEVRLDSVLAETTAAQRINAQQASGRLQQFYDLEKGLALAILKDLGYDEERLRTLGVLDNIRRPQTTSLAALTAFSSGLDAKDRGDYATARAQFEQALRDDPNFELPRRELLALPLAALTSGGIASAVSSSAPSASSATAGMAAPKAGLSTTAVVIGAIAVVGAGVGAGVAASQGGGGPECGNGKAEGKEECDKTDLRGKTKCANLGRGFTGGDLTCVPPGSPGECTYDISKCTTCNNKIRESGEVCDPTAEPTGCAPDQRCVDCTACVPCDWSVTITNCTIAEPTVSGVIDITLDVNITNGCPAALTITQTTLKIGGQQCEIQGPSFENLSEGSHLERIGPLELESCFPSSPTVTLTAHSSNRGERTSQDSCL